MWTPSSSDSLLWVTVQTCDVTSESSPHVMLAFVRHTLKSGNFTSVLSLSKWHLFSSLMFLLSASTDQCSHHGETAQLRASSTGMDSSPDSLLFSLSSSHSALFFLLFNFLPWLCSFVKCRRNSCIIGIVSISCFLSTDCRLPFLLSQHVDMLLSTLSVWRHLVTENTDVDPFLFSMDRLIAVFCHS